MGVAGGNGGSVVVGGVSQSSDVQGSGGADMGVAGGNGGSVVVGGIRVASVTIGTKTVGSVVVGSQSVAVGVVQQSWVSLSLGGSGGNGGQTSESQELVHDCLLSWSTHYPL